MLFQTAIMPQIERAGWGSKKERHWLFKGGKKERMPSNFIQFKHEMKPPRPLGLKIDYTIKEIDINAGAYTFSVEFNFLRLQRHWLAKRIHLVRNGHQKMGKQGFFTWTLVPGLWFWGGDCRGANQGHDGLPAVGVFGGDGGLKCP